MKKETFSHPHPRETAHRLARRALFGFILTFLVARAVVFLIMSHQIPNMYLFMHGTHVHHLNYGIFLLSAVAGYSVLGRPTGSASEVTAFVYGIALGLTFDEFGMWLHLGGSYWQRVSVDAVIAVAALMALIAYARTIKRFESRHLWAFGVLALISGLFIYALFSAGDRIGAMVGPELEQMEISSSP